MGGWQWLLQLLSWGCWHVPWLTGSLWSFILSNVLPYIYLQLHPIWSRDPFWLVCILARYIAKTKRLSWTLSSNHVLSPRTTLTMVIDWKPGAGFQFSGCGYVTCDTNLLKIVLISWDNAFKFHNLILILPPLHTIHAPVSHLVSV